MRKEWTSEVAIGNKKILTYKKLLACGLKPCIGYIMALINLYNKDEISFDKMETYCV